MFFKLNIYQVEFSSTTIKIKQNWPAKIYGHGPIISICIHFPNPADNMQINSQPLSYVIYDHIFCTQNNRLFKQIGLFTQGEPVLNSEKYTVPILVFYGKSIKLLGAGQ